MEATTEVKYYKTIHEVPLNKFIDCIVDGNLSALIIAGYPTEAQLTAAWDAILSEYSDNVGTQEYRLFFELYKEVSIMKITLDQIKILAAKGNDQGELVGILRIVYNEYFAKELNSLLNTDCKFNWLDQKSYHAELDKCVNRSKGLQLRFDLKNIQFEAIQKKNQDKPGTKMDRQYFTSILITLSDHAKYRIEETIKMSEYCERIKRFSDYCEQLKKKK